jgi:hypothetical protein
MFEFRRAGNDRFACAHTNGRAVGALRVFVSLAVNLYQHGVVDLGTKRALDGFQIRFVSVCGQLDAGGEVFLQVMNEMIGRAPVARSNKPANDQLSDWDYKLRDMCSDKNQQVIHRLD